MFAEHAMDSPHPMRDAAKRNQEIVGGARSGFRTMRKKLCACLAGNLCVNCDSFRMCLSRRLLKLQHKSLLLGALSALLNSLKLRVFPSSFDFGLVKGLLWS